MNLKKIGKVFTSNSVGTGPSSYEKRIYRAAVSQKLRNTEVDGLQMWSVAAKPLNKQQYSRQEFVLQCEALKLASYRNLLRALISLLFVLLTKYYNRG
jgi:hypothetical protein